MCVYVAHGPLDTAITNEMTVRSFPSKYTTHCPGESDS